MWLLWSGKLPYNADFSSYLYNLIMLEMKSCQLCILTLQLEAEQLPPSFVHLSLCCLEMYMLLSVMKVQIFTIIICNFNLYVKATYSQYVSLLLLYWYSSVWLFMSYIVVEIFYNLISDYVIHLINIQL